MTAYQASAACSANFPVVFQLGPEALRALENVSVKPPEWSAPPSGAKRHGASAVRSEASTLRSEAAHDVHDVHDVPITSGIPANENANG